MKSSSVGAYFGALGGAFWGGFGEVLGSFWGLGGTIWEVGGELGQECAKKGGGVFLTLPFWPEKVGPGGRREVPRGPENLQKEARRDGEEAM